MLSHIHSINVPVKDQAKAVEFYTTKLGFKVICDSEIPEMNQRWIELQVGDSNTAISLFTSQGQENLVGKFNNISFATNDIDKTVAELKAKGVSFCQEVAEVFWGRMALFLDLDGNVFCIGESNE